MAAPTSSSNGTKPRNRAAVFSLVLGLLAVAAIPVAIVVTDVSGDLRLLHAGFAVPVAFVLGIAGIRLAKTGADGGWSARSGGREARSRRASGASSRGSASTSR